MASKKFSFKYPPFTFTAFKSFEEVSVFVKQLIKALEDIRSTVGRIVNSHADDLDGLPTVTLASLGIPNHDDITVSANGEMTNPTQPAFLATAPGTQTNLATSDKIIFSTERFDQGGNFTSSIFTAPVAGRYYFSSVIRILNTDADYVITDLVLNTSNINLVLDGINPNIHLSGDGTVTLSGSALIHMDAADTALMELQHSGGVDQADIGNSNQSYFSGYLVA